MHGGNVELLAPRYGFDLRDILDFSANINPYGPPPGTQELLAQSCQEIVRYPDPDYSQLRATLADWHNVESKNVTVANGSSELVYWIPRLFTAPNAMIFGPTFTEYAAAVQSAGGSIKYEYSKETEGFQHVFKNVRIGARDKINLVFLGNPNNPTGAISDADSLQNWLSESLSQSPDTLFVIDESFLPFSGNESLSLAPFAVQTSGVILLRSMTKIFSIPGLRLGYSIAHAKLAQKLDRLMPTWRVNILAQKFGQRIFSFAEFLNHSRVMLEAHRNDLIRDLKQLSHLKIFESAANFILLKILPVQLDSSKITAALASKGIIVRSLNDFAGLEKERFIRVAVRKPEENGMLVEALKEIFLHAG